MVRLVLHWLESPWAYELVPGLNKLGRNPTNDFRVSDPSVSSFHAEIAVTPEGVRVRDLGSTNGTFINESRVEESLLKPNDILRLGNIRLQLQEVTVINMAPPTSAGVLSPDLQPFCALHSENPAKFRCQNCGGAFCSQCIKVVGQSRYGATTVCPLCQGQCNQLPTAVAAKETSNSLLSRLRHTLKIPFSR